MYQWVWTSLFIVALATSTNAETYYVATDGKADGDGSKEEPWSSVEEALSKVGGGHTIIVRPGIYRGPIQIAKQYSGTEENPTVIKSEAKWKAVIIGAPFGQSRGCTCIRPLRTRLSPTISSMGKYAGGALLSPVLTAEEKT